AQVVVLDSGHISVESKLVKKSLISEIQSKIGDNYSDENYKQLQSLMYDRFSVQLSSTQVDSKYDLHVIDRINMQFDVGISIAPKAANLTKFKVSGHLPLLKANFSDRKYKIMMNIIDKVTPSSPSSSPSSSPPPPNAKESQTVSREIVDDKLSLSRLTNELVREKALKDKKDVQWDRLKHRDSIVMAEKLGLGKTLHDLIVIDEDNDTHEDHAEEFFDAQDTESHQNAKVNQRTFEFEFKVDKFITTVKKADPDPDKPEIVLVDMVLEHFGLNYVLSSFDMSAEVVLKSLSIEDKMSDTGSEFRHLAASEGYGNTQSDDSEDLVHVKYSKVSPKSPEYMTKYEGIDQSVDIEMSTINVIVTRKSILKLYNFVLDTFTSSKATTTPISATVSSLPSLEEALDFSPEAEKPPSQSTMRVKVKLNSIRFILNNDGTRLATGLLSHARVAVLLRQNTIRVGAQLGNFSLSDDIADANRAESLRQLLTIEGEDLA
ncbi:18096_t:CDS:2, partial [Dentiscutata erythropus]